MKRKTQRFALGSAIILIGAFIAAALVFVTIPKDNEAILNVALGFVLGWGASVVNFYFGTSESSAHKTELLGDRPTGNPGDPVHVEEEG